MDLFILDRDPRVAAKLHCDRDVLGKIIQCAQLLAAVYQRYDELSYNGSKGEWQTNTGRKTYAPYASIDSNDSRDAAGLIDWAAETYGNYSFVRRMMHGFLQEYQRRWSENGKRHKSWEVYESLREPPRKLRAAFLDDRDRMTAFRLPSGRMAAKGSRVDTVERHRALYADSRRDWAVYRKGDEPPFMLHLDFPVAPIQELTFPDRPVVPLYQTFRIHDCRNPGHPEYYPDFADDDIPF